MAHHVVMTRVPAGVTSERIVAEFASLMGATPPAGEPLVARFAFVGYAAPEPAPDAVVCSIVHPAAGQPCVVDGMATAIAAA